MQRALVLWDLEKSPLPSKMKFGLAVHGLTERVRARDGVSRTTAMYGFGHASTMQEMGGDEYFGVTFFPVMKDKYEHEDVIRMMIEEMTSFAGKSPDGTVVLVSTNEVFVDATEDIRGNGITLLLVVNDENEVPPRLKQCATKVWEWRKIYREARLAAGLPSDSDDE